MTNNLPHGGLLPDFAAGTDSSGKKYLAYQFEQGPVDKLRALYNKATDEEIQDAKIGTETKIPFLKALNFAVPGTARRDMRSLLGGFDEGTGSTLIGVRGDVMGWQLTGAKPNLEAPVFWCNRIDGQKGTADDKGNYDGGAFWTFEDNPAKRTLMHTSWINVTPILKDGKHPMVSTEPGKEVYLFKWAANVGDAGARTMGQAIKGPDMGSGGKRSNKRRKSGKRISKKLKKSRKSKKLRKSKRKGRK